ncbi:unnamed protein product, partial [Ectocarpus sp. 12 AP-2014]
LNNAVFLVVTDLDGSLLDHHDYNCDAARPVLQLLEELRIPVVFASSKTREEILALRQELNNEHPFIAENGAAVYVPRGYFLKAPVETIESDGYLVREFAPPRARWTPVLDELRREMPDCFTDFASAGTEGIASMTGLSRAQAELANRREYSEP